MAKTAAEYQRDYRRRKAERERLAGDPTDQIARRRFHEYLPKDGNWMIAEESLASVGVEAPEFTSDDDPQWEEEWGEPYRGSVGRAERMVGAFLDAATELAATINRYKQQEIDRAIAELEKADLTDPEKKKQALQEIVRLTNYRDQLSKQVRWSLPQWKVTGV